MQTKFQSVPTDGNESSVSYMEAPVEPEQVAPASPAAALPAPPADKKPEHWGIFVNTATQQDIKERLAREILEILERYGLDSACCLGLLEPIDSIDSFDLARFLVL